MSTTAAKIGCAATATASALLHTDRKSVRGDLCHQTDESGLKVGVDSWKSGQKQSTGANSGHATVPPPPLLKAHQVVGTHPVAAALSRNISHRFSLKYGAFGKGCWGHTPVQWHVLEARRGVRYEPHFRSRF